MEIFMPIAWGWRAPQFAQRRRQWNCSLLKEPTGLTRIDKTTLTPQIWAFLGIIH
jgi:hypothetical protein